MSLSLTLRKQTFYPQAAPNQDLSLSQVSRQTTFLSRRAALAGAVISHCSLEKRSNTTTLQTCMKAGMHGASTHCNSVGSVGDTSDCL